MHLFFWLTQHIVLAALYYSFISILCIVAEKQLGEAVKVPGHPLQVLQIVANTSPNPSPAEAAVRQASAVHFKNVVKKGWDTNQEVRKNKIQELEGGHEIMS